MLASQVFQLLIEHLYVKLIAESALELFHFCLMLFNWVRVFLLDVLDLDKFVVVISYLLVGWLFEDIQLVNFWDDISCFCLEVQEFFFVHRVDLYLLSYGHNLLQNGLGVKLINPLKPILNLIRLRHLLLNIA